MKDKYVYPHVSDTGPRPGMELRDWFAGMVLQSACRENNEWEAARLAYAYADAMIEERNKEKN
jgi:hypothetical protein